MRWKHQWTHIASNHTPAQYDERADFVVEALNDIVQQGREIVAVQPTERGLMVYTRRKEPE
jgi:hypothetical protein